MGIVARQSIKGTIMNYIGVGVGFVTTFFVLTKYFAPEEVGLTKVLVDASILLSGLAQLGTNTSAMRYYPHFKDKDNHDNGFFGWTLILPIVGFVLFTGLFLLLRNTIVEHFSKESPLFVDYMYFVVPMAFFMLYLSVFETNSNLLMRIVVPKFIREVGIRLMTLAVYLLYAFDAISLDGMVVGICFTYLIATLLNIIYLLNLRRVSFKIRPSFVKPEIRKDFLFYTLFLVVSSLASVMMPVLNTMFVSVSMGLAFTGVFTIAQYIANLVEMPYRSLGAISKPNISQAMKDGDTVQARELCREVSLHQFIAGTFIFLLIWINIDFFFSILPNGQTYSAGKWVFFILGICKIFNSTLNIGATVLSYSRYYYWSLLFTIILAASAIILNNKLIPVWGMEGAALASLASYFIYYLFMLSFIQWKSKINPFSMAEIKTLIVMGLLFAINYMLVYFLTPNFMAILPSGFAGSVIEATARTAIVVSIGISIIYKWKISIYINNIIDKITRRRNDST